MRAITSESDREIMRRSKSTRELWGDLEKWRAPCTQGENSALLEKIHSFKIAPCTNPMAALGRMDGISAWIGEQWDRNTSFSRSHQVLAALPTNGYDTEVQSLAAGAETLSQHSEKVTTRGSYHRGQVPHLRIIFVGEQCREDYGVN